MRHRSLGLIAFLTLVGFSVPVKAGIDLGTAANFAVLAGSTVTNTGSSLINGGDVGLTPGSSITGFTSGTIVAPYTIHDGDAVAFQAQADLATAYKEAAALTPSQDLTGQNLGGLVLTPGVYSFATSALLTGTLTLDDLGDPNAQFVFQVGSMLTTATGSSVVTINGNSAPGDNVYWQVGSSATLGTGSTFEGDILAQSSITLSTGASLLDGGALACNGAVTLDSNQINNLSSVPEPGSISLSTIGGAFVGLCFVAKKRRK